MLKCCVRLLGLPLALLTACGGGGGKDDDTDGPNAAPTAAFTASATTVEAGNALTFDASGSSDPDGDTLTYSWSFGASGRGGTQRIAHVFSSVGSQTVKLTVSDGRGGTNEVTQTVAVTAGPSPVGSASATVRVLSPSGVPIVGASVRLIGGASATTDTSGSAALTIGTGIRQTVRVEASGYARRTHVANLLGTATTGYIELVMQPLGPARTLADASAGGTLEDATGAKVTIAPRSLVGAAGTPVTGEVQVFISPVDVTTTPRAFPGLFSGRGTDGASAAIASYGTVDFNFIKDNEKLDLAPGQSATIEIPVFPTFDLDGNPVGLGKVIPLWSLDEDSGEWIREGEGTIVASSNSPTGFVQRATVGHFSWWNCDDLLGPISPIVPVCCADTDGDGDCDQGMPCYLVGRTCSDDTCDQNGSYQAPLYGPTASIEAESTLSIDIPNGISVAIEAYGPDGMTRGRYVAVKNTSRPETVQIVLSAFVEPPPTDPITLPFELTTGIGAEPQNYLVELTQGQNLYVNIQRTVGLPLNGRVRLLSPSAVELENENFGAGAAVFVHTIDTAGLYTIEVSGQTPSSAGSYRIEIRDVGDAMTVQSIVPAAGSVVTLPLTEVVVNFSRPVNASTLDFDTFKIIAPASEFGNADEAVVSGQSATYSLDTTQKLVGSGFTYRVELTAGVTDNVGEPLVPYVGSFRTADALAGFARATKGLNADVAVSSDGSAIVVANALSVLYYTRYTPGVGWSYPDIVPVPPGGGGQNARISMSDAGIAMVSYVSRDSSNNYLLYSNTFSPSTGWSQPVAIPMGASGGVDSSDRAGVQALDAQGRAFRSHSGQDGSCYYSFWTPGSGWSAAADCDDGQTYSILTIADGAVNASGIGGLAWAGTTGMVVRRFDTATGVLGPVIQLGNSSNNNRALEVDNAGNLYYLRVDSGLNVHVGRLPYDTENEANYEQQVAGLSNNCPAQMAVTPSGGVALAYCQAGPDPYVKNWDGNPSNAWGTPVLLEDANATQRFRIAAAGESFVVVHSEAVFNASPAYRSYEGGVWAGASTTMSPLFTASINGDDMLVGGPHGEVFYVTLDATTGRLR